MKFFYFLFLLILASPFGCTNSTEPTYENLFSQNDTSHSQYTLHGKIIYSVNAFEKYGGASSTITSLKLLDYSQQTIKQDGNAIVFSLAISKDNNTLAFIRRDMLTLKDYLVTLALDSLSGYETLITSSDSIIIPACPSWTYDNKLAYLSNSSNSWQLIVLGNRLNVDRKIAGSETTFSNDGKIVIFSSLDDSLHASLYVYNLTEQTCTLLVKADSAYQVLRLFSPAISPDGKHVVFIKDYNGVRSDEIWIVNTDGTNLKMLASSDGGTDSSYPTWSPDGTKIAFVSANHIYIMNEDGSGKMKLNNTYVDDFAWSN